MEPLTNIITLNNFEKLKELCNQDLIQGKHCWAAAVLFVYFHNNPFNPQRFLEVKNELLKNNPRSGLSNIEQNPLPQYEIMETLGFYSLPIKTIMNQLPNDNDHLFIDRALSFGPLWTTLEYNNGCLHDVVVHGIISTPENHSYKIFITDFDHGGVKQYDIPLKKFCEQVIWHTPNTSAKTSQLNSLLDKINDTIHSPLWANRGSFRPGDLIHQAQCHIKLHNQFQSIQSKKRTAPETEQERLTKKLAQIKQNPNFFRPITPAPSPTNANSYNISPQFIKELTASLKKRADQIHLSENPNNDNHFAIKNPRAASALTTIYFPQPAQTSLSTTPENMQNNSKPPILPPKTTWASIVAAQSKTMGNNCHLRSNSATSWVSIAKKTSL